MQQSLANALVATIYGRLGEANIQIRQNGLEPRMKASHSPASKTTATAAAPKAATLHKAPKTTIGPSMTSSILASTEEKKRGDQRITD